MPKSMTGFGMGKAAAGGVQVEVELGSVNRKVFDVRVSLPRSLSVLEPRVRELVQEKISRGNVTATVRVSVSSHANPQGVVVDTGLSKAFIRELRKTAKELGLVDDLKASTLLRLPEVLQCRHLMDDSERVWRLLKRALNQALGALVAMRKMEGAALGTDLNARLKKLRQRMVFLREQAPLVPERYREKLHKRLTDAGLGAECRDETIAREIVIFADRSDISEEIVRLDSHFKQASGLMRSSNPAGRALDFICQEMFREINTIGSKANDARISTEVIQFKTELESVREQVQNIE